jgi:hypothetical protein
MVHERATLHALNRSRDMPLAHYLRLSELVTLFLQSILYPAHYPCVCVCVCLSLSLSLSFNFADKQRAIHYRMYVCSPRIQVHIQMSRRTGASGNNLFFFEKKECNRGLFSWSFCWE